MRAKGGENDSREVFGVGWILFNGHSAGDTYESDEMTSERRGWTHLALSRRSSAISLLILPSLMTLDYFASSRAESFLMSARSTPSYQIFPIRWGVTRYHQQGGSNQLFYYLFKILFT